MFSNVVAYDSEGVCVVGRGVGKVGEGQHYYVCGRGCSGVCLGMHVWKGVGGGDGMSLYIYVCAKVCVYVCMYVCVCACVCVDGCTRITCHSCKERDNLTQTVNIV